MSRSQPLRIWGRASRGTIVARAKCSRVGEIVRFKREKVARTRGSRLTMILGERRIGIRRIENRSMSFCLKLTLTRAFQSLMRLITNNSLSMKEAIPRLHLTPKLSSKTKSSQWTKLAILPSTKEPTYRHTTNTNNNLKLKVTV